MDLSDIQGRYTVQLQIRILLSVLGFFLPYLLLVWLSLSVLAPFAGIVGVVIWLVVTKNEKAESESSEIIKEIDGTTVLLLYILSFFIPLAGFIVGAIYASKDEEHYKHVGKNCLIFSVLNIILGFIMIVAILGSM